MPDDIAHATDAVAIQIQDVSPPAPPVEDAATPASQDIETES